MTESRKKNLKIKIVQVVIAISFVVASLYTSVKYATCGDKRVVIPNQINLILGAIGLVFALCSCCVATLSVFEFGTTVILPGIAVIIDCLVMMDANCTLENGEELKNDRAVILELVLGVVMAVLGMWDLHRRTFTVRKV